VRTVSPAT